MTSNAQKFSYEEAFSRNLGWVTAVEQQILRGKRVAIAGMGGVGGSHLITLTRLGIGSFHIADFDTFELANFNRQAGARLSSIGKPKATVLHDMAKDINPELDIKVFPEGVTPENLDNFLDGVDIYIDGLDFFVLDVRSKVFARCHELGIPCVTAAPAGMGSAFLIFQPDGMSFEEWFRLDGLPKQKQLVNFMVGLTPGGLHRTYLMDAAHMDFIGQRFPSTGLSCELSAGVATAQALKILLKRGPVKAVPYYHHFDAYACKWKQGRLPGGNNHPWQRFKLSIAYKQIEKLSNDTIPRPPVYEREIEEILNNARWAPSGDNIQPWRFEIVNDDKVIIHLRTAKARSTEDFYDFNDGQPTFLAGGVLLETMRIAATKFNRSLSWSLQGEKDGVYKIAVDMPRSSDVTQDPLIPFISSRSVDRSPYQKTPLTAEQKRLLEKSVGPSFGILWFSEPNQRKAMAKINMIATDIRLRIPECFTTHKHVVDWERNYSPTAIPVRAIGLDCLTRTLMRWLFKDWRRIEFMNKFMVGTLIAQIEMDFLPGLSCGAHFVVYAKNSPSPQSTDFFLKSGEAMQNFWLTATSLGLVMQPGTATQMFAFLGKRKDRFTSDAGTLAKAERIAKLLSEETQIDVLDVAFMGRIGQRRHRKIVSRSVRLPLEKLLET